MQKPLSFSFSKLLSFCWAIGALLAATSCDMHHQLNFDPLDVELQQAAQKGDSTTVQALLAKGANPNASCTENGDTTLMIAARLGHIEVVRQLLEQRVDIDKKNNEGGMTALIYAADQGHETIVNMLLAKGAAPDITDNNGLTALMHATDRGYEAIVQVLIKKEAAHAGIYDIPFKLPPLPYAFDALEPHFDTLTMQVHHGKHHRAYVSNLNKAVAGTGLIEEPIESILRKVSQHGSAVRNNGGGHYNHSLFWTILSPNGGGEPTGILAEAIEKQFGSFMQFKKIFSTTATTHFGSGWVWLYVNTKGELNICSMPNQDNPLMDLAPVEQQGIPILGLDLWEHAYYLRYQNRKVEYIEAFWNLVNWQEVENRLKHALATLNN